LEREQEKKRVARRGEEKNEKKIEEITGTLSIVIQ